MTPKKATVATDFFTRGKKPTTNARVITAKKVISPTTTKIAPSKQQVEVDEIDEVDDFDSSEDEREASTEQEQALSDDDEDDEDDDDTTAKDEIQSDDDSADFGFQRKVETAMVPPQPLTAHMQHNRVVATPKTTRVSKKKVVDGSAPVNVGSIHVGFHQADLSEQEKLLRQFDLASKYGPCTDMTRLERWERALML
ncbi:hypothetical protein BGZ94_005190, partial [Podila epigama]